MSSVALVLRLCWCILVGACIGCVTGTYDRPGYTDPGPQVSIGGVYSIERFDVDSDVDVEGTPVVNARVGYRLSERFAVELEYEYYHEYEADLNGMFDANLSGNGFFFNGKGYLLTGSIQPYLLGGVGVLFQEDVRLVINRTAFDTDDEIAPAVQIGIGIEAYKKKYFALYAEASYHFPFDALEDYEYGVLNAGIIYRFGQPDSSGH